MPTQLMSWILFIVQGEGTIGRIRECGRGFKEGGVINLR